MLTVQYPLGAYLPGLSEGAKLCLSESESAVEIHGAAAAENEEREDVGDERVSLNRNSSPYCQQIPQRTVVKAWSVTNLMRPVSLFQMSEKLFPSPKTCGVCTGEPRSYSISASCPFSLPEEPFEVESNRHPRSVEAS